MKVILPNPKTKPTWSVGDIIVFDGKALMIVNLQMLKYFCLVNLESGMTLFTNRTKDLAELQRIVEVEKNVTAHYAKDDYRIYIEGP